MDLSVSLNRSGVEDDCSCFSSVEEACFSEFKGNSGLDEAVCFVVLERVDVAVIWDELDEATDGAVVGVEEVGVSIFVLLNVGVLELVLVFVCVSFDFCFSFSLVSVFCVCSSVLFS